LRSGAVLVLALLVAALAGCTGTGQEGTGITAKEAAARAEARARDWNGDAALMHLGAWETRNSSALVQQDVGFGLPPDSNVGDGRALVWFTRFSSAQANHTLRLIVFANGTILADEEDGPSDDQAVQRWEIDSPRVVELARGAESVRSILDSPDGEIAVFLGGADNAASDPLWGFLAFSQSVGLLAQGAVGARSGDLLTVRTVNVSEALPGGFPGGSGRPPEEYEFEGTVAPEEPEVLHEFDVEAGRTVLQVYFRDDPNLPGAFAASFAILDPAGNELPHAPGDDSTYFPSRVGTYTAKVTWETRGPPTPVSLGPLSEVSYELTVTVI